MSDGRRSGVWIRVCTIDEAGGEHLLTEECASLDTIECLKVKAKVTPRALGGVKESVTISWISMPLPEGTR